MYSYLALGDSYTCGEAVEPSQTFPNQLVAKLRQQGVEISQPHVIAVTGWTTGELQAAIAAEQLGKATFDLVTLLIGVNNQYRGPQKGYTLDGYKQEFAELLQTALQFAGNDPARLVVLSIPDWGAMPVAADQDRQAIAADIDAYNTVNLRATEQVGAHYVDITPISRQALQDDSLVAPDGLHPSGAMYMQWVEALLPTISLASSESIANS
jgi:lysophospholipase L1-like esterase